MIEEAWLELQETTQELLSNLKAMAEKNPAAVIKSDDYDALLDRAKAALNTGAIRDLKRVEGVMTVVDLVAKVSIILGAVRAAFIVKSHRDSERYNSQDDDFFRS